jgi:hypothetical protein
MNLKKHSKNLSFLIICSQIIKQTKNIIKPLLSMDSRG